MEKGYITLYRQILDNPIVTKDSDHVAVWIHLLVSATHKDYDINHLGKRFTLKRGQLVIGRKVLAEKYKISESKVQRILKTFEIEQQIEQQTTNKNRIITIINYDTYQFGEQQNEQLVNNKWTTTEQQLNTNNKHNTQEEHKEHKKDIVGKPDNLPYKEIIEYLNEKAGTNFRHTGKKNKDLIKARFNEGYDLKDFKTVIDKKTKQWLNDTKMSVYLRPETLFSNKFDNYMGEVVKGFKQKTNDINDYSDNSWGGEDWLKDI